MAALTGLLCWGAGVAAAGVVYLRLSGSTLFPSRPGRVAEAAVAGWILQGMTLLALAALGLAVTPAAALLPVAALLALCLRDRRGVPRAPTTVQGLPLPGLMAAGLVATALARLAWHLGAWPWLRPWSWDVYAQWGLKARFLVSTGGLWRYLETAAGYPFSHGDYPPLVSLHLAAVSWPAGDAVYGAIPDALLATAVVLAMSVLWRRCLPAAAAAALTLLLAWPSSLWSPALVGLADRQLALLGGLGATLILCGRSGGAFLPLVLGGLALIKNEGLVLAAAFALAAMAVERSRRRALPLLLPLAPALLWRAATGALGLANDLVSGFSVPAHAVSAMARLARAALAVCSRPDFTVPALAAATAVLLLFAVPRQRWVAAAVTAYAFAVVAVTLGSPYPLAWQLSTFVPRMLVQLFPPALACLAALVAALSPPDATARTAATPRETS